VGRGCRRHPGRVTAGLWWLDPATVYALSLALIAAVYIGFAVADGRPRVIAAESAVAAVFVIVAAADVTALRATSPRPTMQASTAPLT
jgi:hypothetical protein